MQDVHFGGPHPVWYMRPDQELEFVVLTIQATSRL